MSVCIFQEDLCESLIVARHLRCEVLEKKRFITYMNQQKRTRNSRTDSGTLTPDPVTPDLSAGGDAMPLRSTNPAAVSGDAEDKLLSSSLSSEDAANMQVLKLPDADNLDSMRPATPASDTPPGDGGGNSDKVTVSASGAAVSDVERSACGVTLSALSEERADEVSEVKVAPSVVTEDTTPAAPRSRSGSCNKTAWRERSGSSHSEDRAKTATPEMNRTKTATPDLWEAPEVAPWQKRVFPLSEDDYERMKTEPTTPTRSAPPRCYPRNNLVSSTTSAATPTPLSLKTFDVTGTPANSNPCSPLASSSSGSILEDDPNDPEWTVVQPERKPGIVLKLAKR